MTNEEFKDLNTGDIVKHTTSIESVIVMSNYGARVTAARTYDITNPTEWELISKHHFKRIEKGEND